MRKFLYRLFITYLKTGLFFYTKKIHIVGKENIPKKGAVLFLVNHPNGLIDPLIVTTNTKRTTFYLVRAAAFRNPIVARVLKALNLMPIYRIRDGIKKLSRNTEIFSNCYELLNKQYALMVFPEGGHDSRRTVRTISKGFTRILFGAMETYPDLKIRVIPVGITYQNSSQYPCKVAIHYGTPILANDFYNPLELKKSVDTIKNEVSNQLKELSVHIPADEKYQTVLDTLHQSNVDFTKVASVNSSIQTNSTPKQKQKINGAKPLYYLCIINSIIPWLLWKMIAKKNTEIEFVDTFRFGIILSIFPLFYTIQTGILFLLFNLKIALIYFILSLAIPLAYSKLAATPTA